MEIALFLEWTSMADFLLLRFDSETEVYVISASDLETSRSNDESKRWVISCSGFLEEILRHLKLLLWNWRTGFVNCFEELKGAVFSLLSCFGNSIQIVRERKKERGARCLTMADIGKKWAVKKALKEKIYVYTYIRRERKLC